MKNELIELLRCPKTSQRLIVKDPVFRNGEIHTALLVTEDNQYSYPIYEFIPRFVSLANYADNFGMQWNRFRKTQLDSHSGHPISTERFFRATGWKPENMVDKWVLDVGCGAGRFAEVSLQAGSKVVALDYSSAVDACHANLKHHPNLHVVQGDIYALPFLKGYFPFVYSLGVLQHTPDVAKAFAALPPMVAAGGQLCTDFYWKRLRTLLHIKYLIRPLTKRIPPRVLFRFLERTVPTLLGISQLLGGVPFAGRYLKRLVPVADYTGLYPLDKYQLKEWALLDTFDMLGTQYDSPQTVATITKWMTSAGLKRIEVFQATLLVVRGVKL
jgi:SAM-dependent methyltransferase